MKIFIVEEGEVREFKKISEISSIGRDWIIVMAISEKDAINQAIIFDQGNHPAQRKLTNLFKKVRSLTVEEARKNIFDFFRPPDTESVVLEIEARDYTSFIGAKSIFKKKYWVAEIVGPDDKWKFKREFLNGKVDFTHANKRASRGVYIQYLLEPNRYYDVSSPMSNKFTDRYYCKVGRDEVIRVDEMEVLDWVKEV